MFTIGIVGLGKIARDSHIPAIEQEARLALTCTADPAGGLASVRHFPDIEALLNSAEVPDAIAVCTPPQLRYGVAQRALSHGRHVLLEKPPATTVSEVESLRALAEQKRVTLFCAWHSQFAPAIVPARTWLASGGVRQVRILWREDVRVWHPGQQWIWQPGGFGVFDPGINALSVAVKILPRPFRLEHALLHYPENCDTPIAAELSFADSDGAPIEASFDFLQTGPQTWEITAITDNGELTLSHGGARLLIDGREVALPGRAEYPALYAHFAELVRTGTSDVDTTPLRLVNEALETGERIAAPAFFDPASRS